MRAGWLWLASTRSGPGWLPLRSSSKALVTASMSGAAAGDAGATLSAAPERSAVSGRRSASAGRAACFAQYDASRASPG